MADNFDALVLDGLVNHYSIEDLRTLCLRLGVDHESLPQASRNDLARELIAYMRRHGRLNDLIAQLRQERPNYPWPNAPAETIRRPDIPRQLPPAATHFTGRGLELEQLLAALQPGRIVTLYGPGGIGKTALAAEALHALFPLPQEQGKPPLPEGEGQGEGASRFPGGVLFHSFYGRPAAADCAAEFARSCGVEPNPDPLAALTAALHNRLALLVLDGAEEADDLEALLERRSGCGVLITSRRRADVKDVGIEVERLPHTDALALLRALAGKQADDEIAAAEICELCGNLPLALRLAGAFMFREGQTAAEYLAWLRETPLQALDFGARRRESVNVLLARSAAQVSDVARVALAVAGCLALQPFDAAPVAAALGSDERAARRALGELVNYELLRRVEGRYETTHALVYGYARERMAAETAAVQRLGAYYAALAETESARGLLGYQQLAAERAHVLAVLKRLEAAGDWATANPLVWAIARHDGFLDIQGYPRDRIAALEVGLAAARALEKRYDEGSFLTLLGNAHLDTGNVAQAINLYEQALAVSRELKNRQREGQDLGNLGVAYADLGEVARAIEFHEAALAIQREIGDRRGEGTVLGNLGSAYRSLGQMARAIEQYEAALAIHRETGDRRGEGNQLGNLGIAYAELGQVARAVEFYEAAMAVAREIGHRRNEGVWLGNLGSAYYSLGQMERAIEFYEAALAIAREIGDRRGEGNHLGNLGLAYANLGQVERAIEFHEAALAIAREIGDRRGEGNHLGNLGVAYRRLGQVERAIEQYEAALAVARDIGDQRGEGNHLFNRGLALEQLERRDEAIASFEAALAIYEAIKAPTAQQARKQLARLRGE